MFCDRRGSELVYVAGAPACTLPRARHALALLTVAIALLAACLAYARARPRAPPVPAAPFVPAATFAGARPGYVFTTRRGKTGYYLDR